MSSKNVALEMNFPNRLESLRKKIDLKKGEFSKRLGITPQAYSKYMHGRMPSSELLAKMARTFGSNAHWLLTGEGSMFTGEIDGGIGSYQPKESTPVPVLASIQAGIDGRFTAERPLYYLPRPHGVGESPLYAFAVVGDSMAPAYKEGDIVFATPDPAPASGKDYVIQLEWDELVLKKWHQISAEKVRLISINKEYDPFDVARGQIKAIARVVEQKWGRNARRARIEAEDGIDKD